MTYFEIGNQYFDKQEFEKAIENYVKELSLNPLDIKTLINMSLSYFEIGNFSISLKISNQILAINSNNKDALLTRGNCYQKLNRFIEAEADFTALIEQDPGIDYYYLNRSNARRYLGNTDGENEDLRVCEFLRKESIDPIFSTDAIEHIEDFDLDDFNKSRKRFIDLISVNPNNFAAYFDLGLAYTKILAYKSAIDFYTKALKLHPEKIYSKALFNRANAYFDNKQYQESLKDIETYTQIFSSNPYLENIKRRIYQIAGL